MKTGSEKLIAEYLLGELRAYGLVRHEGESYIFQGANNDYLIELKAFHLGETDRPVRLREPVIDLFPPYDR